MITFHHPWLYPPARTIHLPTPPRPTSFKEWGGERWGEKDLKKKKKKKKGKPKKGEGEWWSDDGLISKTPQAELCS